MPRFADLQQHNASYKDFAEFQLFGEEVMVSDARSQMSPAQVVEQKLGAVLRRDADFMSRDEADGRKTIRQIVGRSRKAR